ncbi:hypothetical protein MKW92_006101 [Papaver armeniacum]|nr:hypothetical protein MKW92_006101 [Papaver armeniacum]
MVEFANSVKGIALNHKNENVGIVSLEMILTGSIVDVPSRKAKLGRVVDDSGLPIHG